MTKHQINFDGVFQEIKNNTGLQVIRPTDEQLKQMGEGMSRNRLTRILKLKADPTVSEFIDIYNWLTTLNPKLEITDLLTPLLVE